MTRLIDADGLLWELPPLPPPSKLFGGVIDRYGAGVLCGVWAVTQMIRESPTVDAVPVVHGQGCEYCNDGSFAPALHVSLSGKLTQMKARFCPNCGRPLEEEEEPQ